jgi:lysophospholipase L1-like esterase
MTPTYVALGDSMSIDDYAGGPGRGAASLLHRNRDDDFPDWAGRDLRGLRARHLARDGATTSDVLYSQLPKVDGPPALVTISMGGNDLLIAFGDVAAAEVAIHTVIALGHGVLGRLRELTPTAPIVVTTVYDPSDGGGTIGDSESLSWPEGLALIRTLNEELTKLAGAYDALVADVYRHFLGHGQQTGDVAQLDARPADRDMWYCGLIEPNAWGAHQIRTVWWQTLRDAGWSPPS